MKDLSGLITLSSFLITAQIKICRFCESSLSSFHLFQSPLHFWLLFPNLFPSIPSHGSCLTGSFLTALHSTSGTSTRTFPLSVTACRGTYALNIKLCSGEESQSAFTWQDRREAFRVWWLSSVLTLCKPEQLVKQGEAVMEKLLIFPRCKSTMGAFEYCIKACWHTDIGNLLYLHGHAPTNKCCRMQKNTRLSTFLHTHPQSNEISALMFLESWRTERIRGGKELSWCSSDNTFSGRGPLMNMSIQKLLIRKQKRWKRWNFFFWKSGPLVHSHVSVMLTESPLKLSLVSDLWNYALMCVHGGLCNRQFKFWHMCRSLLLLCSNP